jgi:hypothetical protein
VVWVDGERAQRCLKVSHDVSLDVGHVEVWLGAAVTPTKVRSKTTSLATTSMVLGMMQVSPQGTREGSPRGGSESGAATHTTR